MPYYATAQEWLTQSTLLLQARPTTTRITTKYTIPNSSKICSKSQKRETSKPNRKKDQSNGSSGNNRPIIGNPKGEDATSTHHNTTTPATKPATLTLKTFDPVSGVTLKYRTNKAAEVGRLVQIMGRLGKGMAGLEMKEKETVSAEVIEKDISQPVETPNVKKPKRKGKK